MLSNMARDDVRSFFFRKVAQTLPFCLIAVVILVTAYGLVHIYWLSPLSGQGKAASAPVAGVVLTAEELKTRLDDLKWLLTLIVSVASLFAILQAAASFFNAQAFSKQADDALTRIEKLAKETEGRYPLFAQTERARVDAYSLLRRRLQFEGFDWRDEVYKTMPLRERQQVLSADWYLSVDLVPPNVDPAAMVRDLRSLANFYASKWLHEHERGGGSLADLERAEYYLELATEKCENDFFLLNDKGVLYLEYYRRLETEPWTACLAAATECFEKSLKKYKDQQRAHYNLGVADTYRKLWHKSQDHLLDALTHKTWEHTPLPEKECAIHYNLACVRARLSYRSHSPVLEQEAALAMESLETAARMGLMRASTVDFDLDNEKGDLRELFTKGPSAMQSRLKELRVLLSQNAGTTRPKRPGRFRRAWEELLHP